MRKVAALYVDTKRGPYPHIPLVECWGEEHDATKYAGPWPVIAHPPCGHWGRYAWKCKDSGDTAWYAVDAVRRWGGVLEQPKDSKMWREFGIPKPGVGRDRFGGFSILVYQRDWGHAADKATWLYIVGCNDVPALPPAVPTRVQEPGKYKTRGVLERMSKAQRHLTPPAFALWLVELARRRYVGQNLPVQP